KGPALLDSPAGHLLSACREPRLVYHFICAKKRLTNSSRIPLEWGPSVFSGGSAMDALPASVLDHLREFTSPTVANAIEVFNVRPRQEGFMRPEIRCVFPQLGVMVGYAVTLKIQSALPAAKGAAIPFSVHWQDILKVPAPRVIVVEDLDEPSGLGSFWGEVNANMHK